MGKRTAVTALLALTACLKPGSPTLTQLTITPDAARVPVGLSLQFEATALMSDGTTKAVTQAVIWAVDDTFVADVDAEGRVSGKHPGTTQLRARSGSVEATRVLTITDAVVNSLELGPVGATVPVGVQVHLVATALLSDGTTTDVTTAAAWALEGGAATATMSEAQGVVTGAMPGTAVVIATFGGATSRLNVTVTAAQLSELTVTPFNPSLPKGSSQALTLTGRFTDGTSLDVTQQASWTSEDSSVAFVSNLANERGVVSGRAAGSTFVVATMGGRTARTPVQVTAATLDRLEMSPATLALPLGVPGEVTLLGVYSDQTRLDLAQSAQWTSDEPAVATVTRDVNGVRVRGVAVGQTTVRASVQGRTASVPVTIRSAELLSVELSVPSSSMPVGVSAVVAATGTFSDGTHQAVDELGTWASSAPTAISVSNAAGQRGRVVALTPGGAAVTLTIGQVVGTVQLTATPAELRRLAVEPGAPTLPAGTTLQLAVQGQYSDGSTRELTSSAAWSSASPAIASVGDSASAKGLLTAHAAGVAQVTASAGSQTVTVTVTVSAATLRQLAVTPASPSVPLGTQVRLVATGTYSDGTTRDVSADATWSSSAEATVTVSNAAGSQGVARGLGLGDATVTATFDGQQSSARVTVSAARLDSVDLNPAAPSVPVGGWVALVATGVYSDQSRQLLTAGCSWSSASPAIATVSNAPSTEGQVRGVAQGDATVRADCSGVTAQVSVHVSAAALARLDVGPQGVRLPAHLRAQLTATGTWTDGATRDVTGQVSWSSADESRVTVAVSGPARGEVTARAAGDVAVSASLDGVNGSVTVTVTDATLSRVELEPAAVTVAAGLTQRLTATGVYSDASSYPLTDLASWAVADAQRARFSAQRPGELEGLSPGATTAQVTFDGVTGTAPVTVTDAVPVALALAPATVSVPVGLSRALVATAQLSDGTQAVVSADVTWSSSSPAVAAVVGGEVTGRAQGQTTVSATLAGLTASVPVTVTPATVVSVSVSPGETRVPNGLEAELTASALYSDGSAQDVTATGTWTSSAATVVVVSPGRVRGAALGSADVQVAFDGQVATAQVTVTAAVLRSLELGPAAASVPVGLTQRLSATGLFSDGSARSLTDVVTWESSDGQLATVSNAAGTEGVLTAAQAGAVTVTASVGGAQSTLVVQIVPAVLQAITLTPPSPSVAAGLERQLTATGTYSDGSTRDVSQDCFWSVVGAAARVGNGASAGLVTGVVVGTVEVRAVASGVVGATQVAVTPALVREVQVTPPAPRTPRGTTVQLTATAVFTDDTHQDVTTQAVWTSAAPSMVNVVAQGSGAGLAQARELGTTAVTATFAGFSADAAVEVTAAQLVGVAMSPAGLGTCPLGSVRQLQLIGTYTDATTQVLTTDVVWQSSNAQVAAVSNALGTQGLLVGLSLGSTTVTATYWAFSATRTFVVNQTMLQSLTLTPAAGSTAVGFSRQFIAIGAYSDGSTQVVTDYVTWSSSDPAKAVISNASPTRGLLSTLVPGAITISATLAGVTETTPHTVTPASLVSVQLSPATPTVQVGHATVLVATGEFSDGSLRTLTAELTWTSSDTDVAQVSNAMGGEGTVTGLSAGSTVVRAAGPNGVSAQVTVTVTP